MLGWRVEDGSAGHWARVIWCGVERENTAMLRYEVEIMHHVVIKLEACICSRCTLEIYARSRISK